jgi:hypothetical protein
MYLEEGFEFFYLVVFQVNKPQVVCCGVIDVVVSPLPSVQEMEFDVLEETNRIGDLVPPIQTPVLLVSDRVVVASWSLFVLVFLNEELEMPKQQTSYQEGSLPRVPRWLQLCAQE